MSQGLINVNGQEEDGLSQEEASVVLGLVCHLGCVIEVRRLCRGAVWLHRPESERSHSGALSPPEDS